MKRLVEKTFPKRHLAALTRRSSQAVFLKINQRQHLGSYPIQSFWDRGFRRCKEAPLWPDNGGKISKGALSVLFEALGKSLQPIKKCTMHAHNLNNAPSPALKYIARDWVFLLHRQGHHCLTLYVCMMSASMIRNDHHSHGNTPLDESAHLRLYLQNTLNHMINIRGIKPQSCIFKNKFQPFVWIE